MSEETNEKVNLLTDDSLLNPAENLGELQQDSTQTTTLVNEIERKSDFTLLSEQLEKIANDVSVLGKELADFKEKNTKLLEQISKLGKASKKKK